MDPSALNALELIGLCLAPWEERRKSLVEEAADKVRDWEQVLLLAGAKHVSPVVSARLRDCGILSRVAEPVAARFARAWQMNAAINALRLNQALKVSSLLRERGISLLYFKGASLVMAGDYPDAGQRMFSDVDVLAEAGWREEVRRAFRDAGGFEEQPSQVMEDWEVTSWLDAWGNEIEAHWSLKPYNGAPAGLAEKRLKSRGYEIEYRGQRVLVPCPEARFIQAALHFTAHHYFDSTYFMTGACDLAHILFAHGLKFDWEWIVERSQEERMLEHLGVAVGLAHELTQFEPLKEAMRALDDLAPGLMEVCRPLSRSLGRMAKKPWKFYSFYERRLFARKSFWQWAAYIRAGAGRKIKRLRAAPEKKKEAVSEFEGVTLEQLHERRFGDADFLRFLYDLFKFDRRIRFRIKIGAGEREDGG